MFWHPCTEIAANYVDNFVLRGSATGHTAVCKVPARVNHQAQVIIELPAGQSWVLRKIYKNLVSNDARRNTLLKIDEDDNFVHGYE